MHLVGGNSKNLATFEGDVITFNPTTGIEGPICDEEWDLQDVSFTVITL